MSTALIRDAAGKLRPSRIGLASEGGRLSRESAERTSSSCILGSTESVLALLDHVEKLTAIPRSRFEQVQISRYRNGEFYGDHLDALSFRHSNPSKQKPLDTSQRKTTVLIWLNVSGSGGETQFPKLGENDSPLNVPMTARGALLFFPTDIDGTIDNRVVHNGQPVRNGEKWIATVWIH